MKKSDLLNAYFHSFDQYLLTVSPHELDRSCRAMESIFHCLPVKQRRSLSQFARSLMAAQRLALSFEKSKISNGVGIYVISLKDSPRREAVLDRHISRLSRFFDYRIIDAVNPTQHSFNIHDYAAVKCDSIPDIFVSGKKSLGHFGCSISHSLAWGQAFSDDSINYALILEDDSCLSVLALQVMQAITDDINAHPERDVDLVFVNNRSARWLSDSFERRLPAWEDFLVPFSDFSELVKESRDNSPSIWNGVNHLIFGGDAYLLTSSGLKKLSEFVRKHGIYPVGGKGLDVGIEKYLCNWLSTSLADNGIGGRPKSLTAMGMSSDYPFLNTFVARFPFSISLQELGLDVCQSQTSTVN